MIQTNEQISQAAAAAAEKKKKKSFEDKKMWLSELSQFPTLSRPCLIVP